MVPVTKSLFFVAAAILGISNVNASNLAKTAQPTSQIQKVIQLLKDMKKQVDDETAAGADVAEETENQCIKDITQLEGDVKYSSEKAETSAATKEDQAAKSQAYATEAQELVPQIATATGDKKKAKEEHDESVATFNKEEAELTEAVTMLTQAYSVLKRSLHESKPEGDEATAFLQKKESNEQDIQKVVTALSAIIESSWVSTGDAEKVKAFIQSPSMASDDGLSLVQQPQAATSNYQSKSGGILTAIQGMQDKAGEELTSLREKALKDKHAFELLTQDLTSKIELYEEQMSAAKANSAEAAAASSKAASEEADVSEALDSFKSQLSDTKASCEKAAADWEVRKTEALEESATIQQAVDVLAAKFGGSFLQLKAHAISSNNSSEISRREQVSSILRRMSEKFESFQLLQAASSVENDPFVKVRKMINEMIVKLEDEQSKEAAKEGKCKADLKKGKTEVKVKSQQLKKLQSRADKAAAKISELQTDLGELADQVKLLKASQGSWTKDRNASRTENAAALQEAKESIEALNAAIGILSEMYGSSASLVQTSTSSTSKTQKLSDKGDAVIQILQTAQSDFEKIRQSTESAEKDAQSNYEKDMQESTLSLAKANALIEGKQSEQASVKVQAGQIDEDLSNASKAYTAATEYLSAVTEACANKPMSFEERQSKRKQEIEGLQEALEILSSE